MLGHLGIYTRYVYKQYCAILEYTPGMFFFFIISAGSSLNIHQVCLETALGHFEIHAILLLLFIFHKFERLYFNIWPISLIFKFVSQNLKENTAQKYQENTYETVLFWFSLVLHGISLDELIYSMSFSKLRNCAFFMHYIVCCTSFIRLNIYYFVTWFLVTS